MKIARILAVAAATAALLGPLPANAAPAPGGDTASPDIAGGSTTTISAAPYAAQISFDATGTSVGCTGSQISASWVITAKHCNSTSLQSVRLGTSYLESGGTVKTVAARYASSTGDVLLLKLSTPHYGSYVSLSSSFPATSASAKVYGWGDQTEGAGTMSYSLKTADVTVAGQGTDTYGGASVRGSCLFDRLYPLRGLDGELARDVLRRCASPDLGSVRVGFVIRRRRAGIPVSMSRTMLWPSVGWC